MSSEKTSNKQMPGRARVLLGEISGAHGIRGEVIVRSYTADPAGIAAYGPLADERGTAHYTLSVKRVTSKGVIATVGGIADRTAAERLRGIKLYVDRDRLPETPAGEYYHADLIGLSAVSSAGEPIGEVIAVANYGAGDILEVKLAGSAKTELLPMIESVVQEVDVAAGRIVIAMPETIVAGDEKDAAEGDDAEDAGG